MVSDAHRAGVSTIPAWTSTGSQQRMGAVTTRAQTQLTVQEVKTSSGPRNSINLAGDAPSRSQTLGHRLSNGQYIFGAFVAHCSHRPTGHLAIHLGTPDFARTICSYRRPDREEDKYRVSTPTKQTLHGPGRAAPLIPDDTRDSWNGRRSDMGNYK